MTQDEALKLALEAYLCREMPAGTVIGDPKWWAPKIANVIKEVLAQPAQEPVAWMIKDRDNRHFIFRKQKPEVLVGETLTPLYTTPPQREWVGLPDIDIAMAFDGVPQAFNDKLKFGKAIEAKLKEKNT